jgi:hypothetical protein
MLIVATCESVYPPLTSYHINKWWKIVVSITKLTIKLRYFEINLDKWKELMILISFKFF